MSLGSGISPLPIADIELNTFSVNLPGPPVACWKKYSALAGENSILPPVLSETSSDILISNSPDLESFRSLKYCVEAGAYLTQSGLIFPPLHSLFLEISINGSIGDGVRAEAKSVPPTGLYPSIKATKMPSAASPTSTPFPFDISLPYSIATLIGLIPQETGIDT